MTYRTEDFEKDFGPIRNAVSVNITYYVCGKGIQVSDADWALHRLVRRPLRSPEAMFA